MQALGLGQVVVAGDDRRLEPSDQRRHPRGRDRYLGDAGRRPVELSPTAGSVSCFSSRACCRRCGSSTTLRSRRCSGPRAMPGTPTARPPSCSRSSALLPTSMPIRLKSPPASSVAPSLRAPSSTRRRCCSPTSRRRISMYEETEREIMEQFRAVNRERAMTLIMVTHNLRLAEQTDRVVHIADGRLVA